jgi:hypothetical protein
MLLNGVAPRRARGHVETRSGLMIECGCLTYRIDLRKRSRELGSGSHHQRRGVDREIMIGDRRTTKYFELVKFLLTSVETDVRLRWNKKVKICIFLVLHRVVSILGLNGFGICMVHRVGRLFARGLYMDRTMNSSFSMNLVHVISMEDVRYGATLI